MPPLAHLEASALTANLSGTPTIQAKVADWSEDVPIIPDLNPSTGTLAQGSQIGLSHIQVVQDACDIKVYWDEMDKASIYAAPSKEVAEILCSRLKDACPF